MARLLTRPHALGITVARIARPSDECVAIPREFIDPPVRIGQAPMSVIAHPQLMTTLTRGSPQNSHQRQGLRGNAVRCDVVFVY